MRSLVVLGAMLVLATSTARAEGIVSARYEAPVERYGHFALGRPHEARGAGARLALLGLRGDVLQIMAQSAPIGTPNRWLNPVGVADLDGDGVAEIAGVTTPHIGGVLRVYHREGERLVELASLAGFSNHVYRSPELELSRPARIDGRTQLPVPDTSRRSLRVIAFDGDRQEA